MIDAQGLAGRGARRVGARAREALPELGVVQDQAHAVVGDVQLICFGCVRGRGEVGADPRRKPRPRVCADRQLGVVQGAGHLVLPVQEGPAVGAQKSVGDAHLVDGQLGPALDVHRLADVEREAAVCALRAQARVHVDGGHELSFAPEKARGAGGEVAGGGLVGDLPGPVRRGPVPARVVDALRAAAAPNVAALALAQGPSPQQLAHYLAEDRPHLAQTYGRSAPKTCLPWELAD